LAASDEQAQWARLIALERNPIWTTEVAAPLREKQRVLKGLLVWDMEREFRVRAWRQDKQIKTLGHELDQTVQSFISIDTAVDSIPETVSAFDSRIALLKPKLDQMQRKLQLAMARHSVYLNGIALDEMQAQRQRLMTYQAQARFALASIYDRISASNE
jgi:predicted  nucleic acid-binding Zn-ribbon protein